eukprot:9489901-Pyramimonas_sp.AAC.1
MEMPGYPGFHHSHNVTCGLRRRKLVSSASLVSFLIVYTILAVHCVIVAAFSSRSTHLQQPSPRAASDNCNGQGRKAKQDAGNKQNLNISLYRLTLAMVKVTNRSPSRLSSQTRKAVAALLKHIAKESAGKKNSQLFDDDIVFNLNFGYYTSKRPGGVGEENQSDSPSIGLRVND